MGSYGTHVDRLPEAVARLADFLRMPLTQTISALEHELEGASLEDVAQLSAGAGIDPSLLDAALDVRAELGRLNDLVHAAAITLVLPRILQQDERIVRRPSLGAGNDPTRPYDLETDRRVAEFKLSVWKGADAGRKRQTFKDLVHLAADTSGRQPELYVVGGAPIKFLKTSASTAAWGLDRYPATARLFIERFGPLEMSIADFRAGPGFRVHVYDLAALVPDVMNRLAPE